ncbi:hypothetical protein JG687_00005473 [Phytophthora cactorum]|uniref:U6 snRNA-associated Sm-like protein LSm4 n=1 Tax=Phytophthora cactorum TaxID=29920 RepID=A0A8T1UKS2_9STRA|nr:hypothetical protein JG687_00005473 [Phytophthora cactorum]
MVVDALQLVELKNGDTYNGHLVNCDTWMNVNLREVICTSKDGDRFWKMPECYIRGNTIKYIRVPNEILDMEKSLLLLANMSDFAYDFISNVQQTAKRTVDVAVEAVVALATEEVAEAGVDAVDAGKEVAEDAAREVVDVVEVEVAVVDVVAAITS